MACALERQGQILLRPHAIMHYWELWSFVYNWERWVTIRLVHITKWLYVYWLIIYWWALMRLSDHNHVCNSSLYAFLSILQYYGSSTNFLSNFVWQWYQNSYLGILAHGLLSAPVIRRRADCSSQVWTRSSKQVHTLIGHCDWFNLSFILRK